MIKATELRIGNWVDLKNSEPVKIDVDNIHDVANNPAIFDPIPLTSEILYKCGFNRNNNTHNDHWDLDDFTIQEENNEYEFFGSEWTHGKPFYYLHQLQNLYFALTGEELKIEL